MRHRIGSLVVPVLHRFARADRLNAAAQRAELREELDDRAVRRLGGERRGQFVVYRLNSDNLVNTLSQFAMAICPVAGPLKRESKAAKKAKKK